MEAVKGYGPACPSCGSIRSKTMENGWSEPRDDYLRRKRCNGCGEGFVTIEAAIPQGLTTFYRLDYRGRHNRRAYYRTRHSKTKRELPNLTRQSDQVEVYISVKRPRRRPTCAKGHRWTPENTYIYPESGHRACRTCRRATQRAYYRERRAEAA